MPERELSDEQERKIVHREDERSEGDIHERHEVREESFGPAGESREPEVVREEIVRASRYSGADREEVLDTHEDRWSYSRRVLDTLGIWVGVMLAVVEVLLALRLVFAMSAANPAAGFVAFTYGSTGWMAAPFQGIGPNGTLVGGGVFEPATLAAMLVYPLLAVLIILLLRAIARSPRPDHSYVRHSSKRRTL